MTSYIDIIRAHSSAKIVLRTHNVEHQIWERHLLSEKNWVKKIYLTIQNNRLKAFEIDAFSKVDAIVTITDDDKKIIAAFQTHKPLHTCLTGINLNSYKPTKEVKYPNTLFHFASMDWMPNVEAVDWLLNYVWDDLLKKIPNVTLVLAGKGMPDRIKKRASKNIIIIEHVTSSAEFYNTYDIMLVPLHSGSGLRIKIVEGLAYGKSIITTSIGAEGVPYTHQKDIYIANTPIEFVEAISELFTEQSKKQELQYKARTLAENHFDYKKIAEELILFYRNLR